MRTGHMLVAAAGPAMNVVFGMTISLVHVLLINLGVIQVFDPLSEALWRAAGLNFILVFFNLIPAPPLDGGAVLAGLLPARLVPAYERFAVYGPFVLMAVIFIDELRWVFVAPALWLHTHWYAVLGLS
jgi:Zn-dependent protease